MQSLMNTVEKAIIESVRDYIERINKKYPNTDKEALLDLWNANTSNASSRKTSVVESEDGKSDGAKSDGAKSDGAKSDSGKSVSGCIYTSTKGKNAGRVCGIKPKDGGNYCSTHKKYEGKTPKEKKVVPKPKTKTEPKKEPKTKSKESAVKSGSARVFRKHKELGVLYHQETQLAIKSPEERRVIGKIVDNVIQPLTQEDIETCKQWSFPYDSGKDSGKDSDKQPEPTEEEKSNSTEAYIKDLSKENSAERRVLRSLGLDDSEDEEELVDE